MACRWVYQAGVAGVSSRFDELLQFHPGNENHFALAIGVESFPEVGADRVGCQVNGLLRFREAEQVEVYVLL